MRRARLAALLARRVGRDPLLRTLRSAAVTAAAEVWLVGGYVRDAALGANARDVDLVAGRGAGRFVRELASAFGVRAFRFRKRGVTTWRLAVAGRLVDVVDAARRGLAADLRRRELTVNAVAFDLRRERIADPLGGLADLRAGRLRCPERTAMGDDPVRPLRAARFLAQFPGLRLTPATRAAVAAAAPHLRRTAGERVRDELDKLLAARAPVRGLDALAELGLLEPILPELLPLAACRAGTDRPDVWRHTLDAIALSGRAARLPGGAAAGADDARRMLRWALLLHDVAKPETLAFAPDGRPTFHGHEVVGARRAEAILSRLRLPTRERRRVRVLILNHLRPGHLADAGGPERGLRRLVRDAGADLPLLVLHAACDARASGSPGAAGRWRRLRKVLLRLLELGEQARRSPVPRWLDGRTLMRELDLEPGPFVGELLRAVREQQELGLVRSPGAALAFARRLAAQRRPARRSTT